MDYEGSMLEPGMPGAFDLDGAFEPQTRVRSNTWPCQRPEEPGSVNESGGTPPHQPPGGGPAGVGAAAGLLPVKKNSSRRNAWGNLSYADLITQAITSSTDKRLTLSQIYEWMVQHVPYFKDKGDSNSSAGWKNSIRHNLSLHNRFMRVQNEGTGKSSWWMINPDAKPGKSARRRATSMETSKFEKRRGRVKKKVEALRNGSLQADATPSPSSSVSEGLDLFPDSPPHQTSSFQLSPDFRPRASSNASSCGRLSPIPAVIGEAEWTGTYANPYSPEQLAGNLAESMKLVPGYSMYQTSPTNPQQQQQSQQQQQQQQQQSGPPPPSYYETQYQRSNALRSNSYALPPTPQSASQQRCPLHRLQPCTCPIQSLVSSMSPTYQNDNGLVASMSPTYQNDASYLMQDQPQPPQSAQQPQSPPQQPQQQPQPITPTTTQAQTTTTTQQQQVSSSGNNISPIPSTMMGQLMGALNNTALLDDLNLNLENFEGLADIDQDFLIQHELQINGTLDINFQQGLEPTGLEASLIPTTVESLNAAATGLVGMDSGLGISHPVASAANVAAAGMASNAASAAAVYASTNAATPASASPSWVH